MCTAILNNFELGDYVPQRLLGIDLNHTQDTDPAARPLANTTPTCACAHNDTRRASIHEL